MMKTNYTPGPWFVIEDCVNGNWPRGCEIAIDDKEFGNEERNYYLASAVHGDPDELLANARLIAAAPDPLEALIEISKWTKQYTSPEHPISTIADAAIAKAIGKTE